MKNSKALTEMRLVNLENGKMEKNDFKEIEMMHIKEMEKLNLS